ncbi:site-specific integrase [Prevotella sp. P6B1]|uniref:tyrosine-type recombinase/integrase n=1 Tax=Prevotella sp. P6B1 TaxID=1410613 RepID=UPI00068AB64F|nr:site-specific integrase [Prevotella sp. P6B1]
MSISIKFELHIHINKCESKKQEKTSSVSKLNFLQAAETEVERLQASLSQSTTENYKTALRALKRYMKQDIDISQVNQQLMKGFERWLRDQGLCTNSISCYMRSIRSLLNRIKGENPTHAFDGVYTGRAKTEKRAITEADITSIKQTQLRPQSFLCLVRDIFLFSYYALGMPFVDIAFLRRHQITDQQLVYHRHKTGQRVVVPLEPCMLEIINRYQSDSGYVFPLLKSNNPQKAYQEYLLMLNHYNRSLKTLARKAGLSLRLTSYTARHTWASVAYGANVDLPVISKALGHTNPQTTLTYIKEINDNRLAEANRIIVNRL